MNRKDQLPIKWMVGIVIAVVAIVSWTHEISKNIISDSASNASSHFSSNDHPHFSFLQFLANLFGFEKQGASSILSSGENGKLNKNAAGFEEAGNLSLSAAGLLEADQSQLKNSTGNNLGNNGENNLRNNAGLNSEQEGSGILSGMNAETNEEKGPGNLAEMNAENNADNVPQDNSEYNSENNAETNADQGPGNLSGPNNGNNPGNNAGTTSDQESGDTSGGGSDNNSGSNEGGYNPSDLPTINPIPSDDTVSQSITKQDQQSDALAALVAAHQAIVVPVQQQAQASKFQTVNSQDIPAVSTSQPPADTIAKIKSNQITVTH